MQVLVENVENVERLETTLTKLRYIDKNWTMVANEHGQRLTKS